MQEGFKSASGTLNVTFATFFVTKTAISLLEEIVEERRITSGAMERLPTFTIAGVRKNCSQVVSSLSIVTCSFFFLDLGGGGDGPITADEAGVEGTRPAGAAAPWKFGTPKKDALLGPDVAAAAAAASPSNVTLFPPFLRIEGPGDSGSDASLRRRSRRQKKKMCQLLNAKRAKSRNNNKTHPRQDHRHHWYR